MSNPENSLADLRDAIAQPQQAQLGEIRQKLADLDESIVQIRQWREAWGKPAPNRPPDRIDDELLRVCQKIIAGLRQAAGGNLGEEAVQTLSLIDFADVEIRIDAAIVARINKEARAVREAVGHRVLQRCFSDYGGFFALVDEAVPMSDHAQNHLENRARFLEWAGKNLPNLISLHKRLLASESAAVNEKWWRNFGIAVAIAIPLIAAVIGVIVAFASQFAN